MAASVGGLFQFVRLWHFADKPTTPGFVAYWTNNGQRAAFALCVPKTSSNTLELAGPRWLTWRRLVCSSSPSATISSRTALSRDFAARNRQEFAAS